MVEKDLKNEINIKGGLIYCFLKRLMDFILALIAIIIFLIPMLIISIAIKIDSRGKIFFIDKRIGYKGCSIDIFKFRTMYQDAEANIKKYLNKEQMLTWEKERKIVDDPRITKVGKFLRKTSLDELPQLFNILSGSLSFVGPRPITIEELTNNYSEEEQELLKKVKPGLTGVWQVTSRSDADYTSGLRQKEELSYLPRRSLHYDLLLLFLTIPAVLKQKGAK